MGFHLLALIHLILQLASTRLTHGRPPIGVDTQRQLRHKDNYVIRGIFRGLRI